MPSTTAPDNPGLGHYPTSSVVTDYWLRRSAEPLSSRANGRKFAGYGPTDARSSPRVHIGSRRPAPGARQAHLVLAHSRRYAASRLLLIERSDTLTFLVENSQGGRVAHSS